MQRVLKTPALINFTGKCSLVEFSSDSNHTVKIFNFSREEDLHI